MKHQLTPEAFNAAPGLIPALSMREVKTILKEFRPLALRRRRFSQISRDRRRRERALAAGQLSSVAVGLDKLLNQAFFDYVMERLSRQGISSRTLSIQIRESTTQRGALDEHTLRLQRYIREQRKNRNRHSGNPEMSQFVDALLVIYAQTGRAPGLSRSIDGNPDGPCVRFICGIMNAYAAKLQQNLRQMDRGLYASLRPPPAAIFGRIKRSAVYRVTISLKPAAAKRTSAAIFPTN